MNDLAFLSAADLGRRIARREISPLEVVDDALSRIERLDGLINSYVVVLGERARAEARAAEQEIAASGARGPLHGVPLALKDIFDTAGIVTASGSKLLRDNVPDVDAEVVRRLRAAGTILLGKLNMHEFAFGLTTSNPHFGATRNPWNREHVPGGSSGGSSAALAAGLCHLSLGTDTGGSIRLPAAACGIVGLKPTFGRVSRRGVLPLSWSLDHVGPMTRTVEDAGLLMNVLAGHDPADSWSARDPVDDVCVDLERGVRGLRLGVPRELFFDGLDAVVERAIRGAVDVLVGEGALVVDVSAPSLRHAYATLLAILMSEASAFHLPWLRNRPDEYGDDVRLRLQTGILLSAVEYVDARRVQQMLRDELEAALTDVDVLVCPTLPRSAIQIGEVVSRDPQAAWNRFMPPFNLSGLPAISVPCGLDGAGLPIGLQIAGRPFDERTVLRAARAYERATAGSAQRPVGF